MKTVQEMLDLYEYLDTQRMTMKNEFQDIVDYVLPDRSNITRWETPGQRRGIQRYDATAVEALEVLAGNFAATLTPMSAQWFDLVVQDPQMRMMKEVADWSQECRDAMLAAMATSNFYMSMDEVYLDLCGFGTAAPYAEMLGTKLHYMCWPLKDYVFTIGIDGRALSVFRKFRMTPAQIRLRFEGKPGFKQLGQFVQDAFKDTARPSTKHEEIDVLHVIAHRDEYVPGRQGAENMPIQSAYVNVRDKVIIAEGGYEEMPVGIARYRVTADDAGWGRGPGFTAMPDIRSLNAVKKMMHKAAAKDLDPSLIIDNKGVIGSVRTMPNGITYIRPGSRMEYLTSGQRMDFAQFDLQELKQSVRAVFYADHLRLPPPQGTPMTATETQIRWELMERLLGPTLGRLQTELLNPIVERTFGLMMRAGQLPPPPEVLVEFDATVNIEYQGPLARAQKMPEVAAIERTYATASSIAQLTGDPSVLNRLNGDEAVKRVAALYGYPADALRSDDEVEQIREAQAAAQQGMQERQDAALAADMASKVKPIRGQAA